MKLDILFLHSGGFNPKGLQGPYFPIGLVGMASYLEQKGFKPYIINLLLEKILNPRLDFRKIVAAYDAPVVGIDLHWFVHSYEAIELARLCKEVLPGSKIILGGLTASQFDREIMANFPFIDVIVRGDAELPVERLLAGSFQDLTSVPNITYRGKRGEIVRNQIGYAATTPELDAIDFMRFDLVLNWEKNLNLINTDYLPLPEIKRSDSLGEYYDQSLPVKSWILYTGRGCSFQCSFCGGSSTAFEQACGRKLVLRSPEKIAADIIKYDQLPVDTLYFPHSPLIIPGGFHNEILDRLPGKLRLGFIFEDSPFIIDQNVIGRYLEAFDSSRSIFRIYLADIEEKAARFNNFPVNIDKVNQLIDLLAGKTFVMIGALIGLPGQTRASTEKMAGFLKDAKRRGAIVVIYNAELHPGSELFLHPAKYNIKLVFGGFMDYYNYLKDKTDKQMIYGYRTQNEITLDEQRQILEAAVKS